MRYLLYISLMDILQNCILEVPKISAASFNNSSDKLSIPVALFVPQFFRRFKMEWVWIV